MLVASTRQSCLLCGLHASGANKVACYLPGLRYMGVARSKADAPYCNNSFCVAVILHVARLKTFADDADNADTYCTADGFQAYLLNSWQSNFLQTIILHVT